jgi:hypothetical protein
MKFRIFTIAALAALTVMSITACNNEDDDNTTNPNEKGTLELEFDNVVGEDHANLILNGPEYTNAAGEKFTVSLLNYYISNIVLEKKDGTEYVVPQDSSYFLIKESDPSTHSIELSNIPAGEYTHFHFTVGVDSLRNTMDISQRTGVLDPASNTGDDAMYWGWNSGYIFFKMEGLSPSAPADPNGEKKFRWHVGGFGGYSSKTINNIKEVEVHVHEGDEPASVGEGKAPHAHIFVNILKAFEGEKTLKIADIPTIHFNPLSVDIANNYQHMFELDHIHQ